jgi:hypothetical protein
MEKTGEPAHVAAPLQMTFVEALCIEPVSVLTRSRAR